ncbi:hypothetical protein N7461_002163 [Penicillium sp. DV-2018c]|nr:hypothetical protein N7461_002163 [Penicillium sp. DV-2018c]
MASSAGQDETESATVTTAVDPQTVRLLEARLLHQWMTSTYHTLSQDGLSAHHLSMIIPRMASTCPYLLDSIHALSALHLASIETDNRVSWIDSAVEYQSQACSGLSKVLANISPPDYEPAFVASIFIMLLAMGVRVLSLDNRPMDPLSVVLEVRTLMSGPAMLFSRINEAGSDAQLDGWLCVPETEENLEAGEHKQDILKSLDRLHSIIHTYEGPHQPIYQITWQQLHQAIEPWPKLGHHGGPIAWPLHLEAKFLSLLQDGDWVARVLFLHYGIAMRLLCQRWYVRDWGRRLVMATLESLDEIPQEWEETTSWIRRAAERED